MNGMQWKVYIFGYLETLYLVSGDIFPALLQKDAL